MEVPEGRPIFIRKPESRFTLANFMRSHLLTSLSALKVGTDLLKEENVRIDSLTGHGGLFKTKGVGQRFLAAAFDAPVSVTETAGEGGAWGMALLASYMIEKKHERLGEYLDEVFSDSEKAIMQPDPKDVEGFMAYIERYKMGISIEKQALKSLP